MSRIRSLILRLFAVDLDETFWRIVGFGEGRALVVGSGDVYNRFYQRLAEGGFGFLEIFGICG